MPEFQPSKENLTNWRESQFIPHRLLANQHLMTIIPGLLPRRLGAFRKTGVARLFKINAETSVLGHLHLQQSKSDKATVIILHGLEGSSESSHVLGIGSKVFAKGFNVLRLNMRTCGGSMQHATSLYHAGLWQDLQAVMRILATEDGLKNFMLVGYSLGGNLILNAAAHHEKSDEFRIEAVVAVSPSIDLAHSVEALELPENHIYQVYFVESLKKKILAKFAQQPHIYKREPLDKIRTIRQFDDRFTAPHGGFGTAARYYEVASSLQHINKINVPTLIISAEDDPLVPIDSFTHIQSSCPVIELLITKQGGHGGFLQNQTESEHCFDKFWAENRVVDYLREVSIKLRTNT